jgi:hypothetical protein
LIISCLDGLVDGSSRDEIRQMEGASNKNVATKFQVNIHLNWRLKISVRYEHVI